MAGGRQAIDKLLGRGAYDSGTGRQAINKLMGTGAYGPNAKKDTPAQARAPARSSRGMAAPRPPAATRVAKAPEPAPAPAPAKKKADTRVASTKAPAPAPRRSAADILGLSEDNAVMKRLRAREKGTQVAAMNKGGLVKGKKGKC